MNERQFIRNVRAIVQVQNRKRFDAGAVLDQEILRCLRRGAVSGMTQTDLNVFADRLRQIAVNEAVGVIAGYVPPPVSAMLALIQDEGG